MILGLKQLSINQMIVMNYFVRTYEEFQEKIPTKVTKFVINSC